MISDTWFPNQLADINMLLDSLHLLLIDGVLTCFGQGGSQEMILEGVMFSNRNTSIDRSIRSIILRLRDIFCHLRPEELALEVDIEASM